MSVIRRGTRFFFKRQESEPEGDEAPAAPNGSPTVGDEAAPLVHPVYLNAPMMFSFLAAIQGGYSLTADVSQTTGDSKIDTKAGKINAGVLNLLGVTGIGAEASLARETSHEITTARTERRQHTEASLFNLLLRWLREEDAVQPVTHPSELESLRPGDLVEVEGEVRANPLEQLLDLYLRFVPYVGVDAPVTWSERAWRRLAFWMDDVPEDTVLLPREQVKAAVKKKSPEELTIINIIRTELGNGPVCDLVLDAGFGWRSPLSGPLRGVVVLTVSREYLNVESAQYLLGGRFTVLGKVTSVLTEPGDAINLTRRATIGALGSDVAQELVANYPIKNVESTQSSPIVAEPSVQVLPLAIYI